MAEQNTEADMAIETDGSSALMNENRHTDVPVPPELAGKHAEFLSWEFGLFMHFNMATWYDKGWGNGYEDPLSFAPDQLDCNQWADAAASAGMKYAVLTAKHTEGYPLWPSKTTTHDITAFKNFREGKGDLIEEYVTAFRKAGIKVGLYYCLPGDFTRPGSHPALPQGAFDLHGMPPEARGEADAMSTMILEHIRELLCNYGKIDLMWFDQFSNKYTRHEWSKQKSLVHSLQPDCIVIGNNSTNYSQTDIHSYEYPWLLNRKGHVPGDELPPVDNKCAAEVCDSAVPGWFWRTSNEPLFGAKRAVEMLETCHARSANYLLNVSPDRSGLIRSPFLDLLQEIGRLRGCVMNINPRTYELWEDQPAPNRGHDYDIVKARGYPFDQDWEEWSYPIGNGYIGANLFGRTDTERLQITDKTLAVCGPYNRGGLTNFAEVYLQLDHNDAKGYRRALNLNTAIAEAVYESDGVRYEREYFASYPDKVVVVRLTASQPGALTCKVSAEIPYLASKEPGDKRTGKVVVENDLITLAGTAEYLNFNYEGQIKVLHEGGELSADSSGITVSGASEMTILIATGTNYVLGPHIFLKDAKEKLDPVRFPHDQVTETIHRAMEKGYDALKATHLQDYQNLFSRVAVDFGSEDLGLPTSQLLKHYQEGQTSIYLEELMFYYGRYLLIASSREKSLPANLQGTWSQYEVTPWSGGYWHNINVQMNYWGAMSANLGECFEAYISFFEAALPTLQEHADRYVKDANPHLVGADGDNGWIIGTGANAYHVPGPGGHSGPGTGGFTSKMLMEYYLFSKDEAFLRKIGYPALRGMSRFFSKALHATEDDLLLIKPSASPENMHDGKHVITTGCTFDQGFVWENHADTIKAAEILGERDSFIDVIKEQLPKLDPIHIGSSGQIKEYREEDAYSDIGDPKHRHISHLCPLYPGTLINSDHPDWMAAASKTLDLRGDHTTGWAMAHRMNCRARLKEGEKAHRVYQLFIAEKTLPNLWATHPPFQIDGNLGVMTGIAEMLLQSHEGSIEILPALPDAWSTGSFKGLVARGNFVVDAEWQEREIVKVTIRSRSGGTCRLAFAGAGSVEVVNERGEAVPITTEGEGLCCFSSRKGEAYSMLCKSARS